MAPGQRDRVEVTPSHFGIGRGQQNLRDKDAVSRQRLLIGVCQSDLPCRRRRLTVFEAKRRRGQAKLMPAERDRAGGDDDDFLAARPTGDDIVGKRAEPVIAKRAFARVDQHGRADLDDQAPCLGKAVQIGCHSLPVAAWPSLLSACVCCKTSIIVATVSLTP